MLTWLTETTLGKIVATFFISMAPVVELRAGLPYGIALGLDYPVALAAAVLGNLLPVPFIIVFIRRLAPAEAFPLRGRWPAGPDEVLPSP